MHGHNHNIITLKFNKIYKMNTIALGTQCAQFRKENNMHKLCIETV